MDETKTNIVDKLENVLEDEFKIITLNTEKQMDLFLRTWLACSTTAEEQRFLGIMDHCCLKYLQHDVDMFKKVKAIDSTTVRNNRKRIILQLYADEVNEFMKLLTEIKLNLIIIIEKAKIINKETKNWRDWFGILSDYLNGAINLYKLTVLKVKGIDMFSYIDRLESVYNNFHAKYTNCQDQIASIAEICAKIYNLTGIAHEFNTEVASDLIYTHSNNKINISLSFFTTNKNAIYELQFPTTLENNSYPFYDFGKYAIILSQYAMQDTSPQ